jgi:hypothetical protein
MRRTQLMKKDWRELAVAGLAVLGGIALIAGWVGVSQNNEPYEQLTYLFTGGVGGLACLLAALGLHLDRGRAADRARIDELNDHLRSLELGLGGEFDEVLERLDRLAGDRRSAPVHG